VNRNPQSAHPLGDRAVQLHHDRFAAPVDVVAVAPGRVNLIGDHTDYNAGFVLPMAIGHGTVIAASRRTDRRLVADSERFGTVETDLDSDARRSPGWARYLHGMDSTIAASGVITSGWNATVVSDIPGSSLSSSAALEMAAGLVIATLADHSIPPIEMAQMGQHVENTIIGVPSGIMDQLICATGQAGHASLIDCRDLSSRPVRLVEGATVVILDTGTRRGLVDSEYAARRRACERVADTLGVAALRDATLGLLGAADLDPGDRAKARHVITENQRTLDAAQAAADNNIELFGKLMHESHASLRDDFEVSGPALDKIVDVASSGPGCVGARMTGGGFAGAAIALVHTNMVDSFVAHMASRYTPPAAQPASDPPAFLPVSPAAGARVLQLHA